MLVDRIAAEREEFSAIEQRQEPDSIEPRQALPTVPAEALRDETFDGRTRSWTILRYVGGLSIALGWFAVLIRPAGPYAVRAFDALPALIYGDASHAANDQQATTDSETSPRWWWFVIVGWWASVFALTAAWLFLLTPSSVNGARAIFAAMDGIVFLPKPRDLRKGAGNPAPVASLAEGPRRVPVPPSVRLRVLDRDGFRCRYCGRAAIHGATLHVDHVIPVVKGGTNDEDNLVTACQDCNLGKGARTIRTDLQSLS